MKNRILSIFIAFILIISTFVIPAQATTPKVYDTAAALRALRHAVGLIEIPEHEFALYDLNKDGKIDTADALIILRIAVGLLPHPDESTPPTETSLLTGNAKLLFDRINADRAREGVPALTWNADLALLARDHANALQATTLPLLIHDLALEVGITQMIDSLSTMRLSVCSGFDTFVEMLRCDCAVCHWRAPTGSATTIRDWPFTTQAITEVGIALSDDGKRIVAVFMW
jgi:hypothetical protein